MDFNDQFRFFSYNPKFKTSIVFVVELLQSIRQSKSQYYPHLLSA